MEWLEHVVWRLAPRLSRCCFQTYLSVCSMSVGRSCICTSGFTPSSYALQAVAAMARTCSALGRCSGVGHED